MLPNLDSNTVTVINGSTDKTTTVPVGRYPKALAINPLTNKIFVANGSYSSGTGTLTVIDGATNATTPVSVWPLSQHAVAIDVVTNQICVSNAGDGTVTIIDAATYSTSTISVGDFPALIAVNPVTGKIYVTNDVWDGSVTMIDGASGSTADRGGGPRSLCGGSRSRHQQGLCR